MLKMSKKVLNTLLLCGRTKYLTKTFRDGFRQNSTAAHTIKVAEQIKLKREEALLGGGLKRIEQQHKKVGQKRRHY